MYQSEWMELRQLVYFEAVVRCGGFTRASEHLRIAQPAVSAQIKMLETELGTALLARTTRRVSLTQAGELFLVRARRVLNELNAAQGDLAELGSAIRGRLTLGATQVLGTFDLPAALARFHTAHPPIELALRSGLIAPLLGLLDSGDVDLVLGPIHDDLPARFQAERLADEELVLATAPGHPLTGPLTLDQLRDEPFVCLPAGSGLRAILDTACGKAGFTPRVQFETYGPASVRALVSAGLGVALLARSAAEAEGPAIGVHALRSAPAHPPAGVIHLRDRALTPVAAAFRQQLPFPRT